jgi:hypothetical protein
MAAFSAFLGAQGGAIVGGIVGTALIPILGPAGPIICTKIGAMTGAGLAGGANADDSIGPSGDIGTQNGGWARTGDGGLGW